MNRFCADRLREAFTGHLSGITAKQVEDYKVKRRTVVSSATVNRELALLKHMCTKALQWGYLKAKPLQSVKFLKEPPGRLRYLTRQEMEALVAACPPHLRPIVVVALHTGMRKSEVLGLMNLTLREELQRFPRHLRSAYVFCNVQGQPYDEVKRSSRTACRKAGFNDFRFHDLRHTFASYLVMNNVNLKAVQHLLGHKDVRMTLRYSHLSQEHL